MLDVHPPHAAAHTWRDFFIHIATICVGLLIAIGLEQSIEGLHRHHEAVRLRDSLRDESQEIVKDAKTTASTNQYRRRWLESRIEQVRAAVWQHQPLAPPSAYAPPQISWPDDPIWRSAKTSGLVARLTPDEVNAYSEVEVMVAKMSASYDAWRAASSALRQFEQQLPNHDDAIDFTQASTLDMRAYLGHLTAELEAIKEFDHFNRDVWGDQETILQGDLNFQHMIAAESKYEDAPLP